MKNELMLTDNGYQQLMKHACRLAQDGHGELAQHLRDAIDLRARIDSAPAAEVQTAPKVIRNDDGNYVIEGSPPAGPLLDALLAQCELKAEAQRLRDAASALCGALTASELNDMAYHALNALRRCVKGANDATN